jgi:hypothetical protein
MFLTLVLCIAILMINLGPLIEDVVYENKKEDRVLENSSELRDLSEQG